VSRAYNELSRRTPTGRAAVTIRTTWPLLLLVATAAPAAAQVERVWLTHRTADASKLVVNWTTRTPGDSVVR
jgi:hypothetical protein